MSSASSTRSSMRRRSPYIPLIPCPDCGKIMKKLTSGTQDHKGWVVYKCEKHAMGCNFWHWELDYVIYLLDRHILRGEQGVEAIGWAEDRQLELKMRAEELADTTPGQDEVLKMRALAVTEEGVLVLKIVAGLIGLLCILLVVKN